MEVDQLNLEDLESEEAIALIHYDESNKSKYKLSLGQSNLIS